MCLQIKGQLVQDMQVVEISLNSISLGSEFDEKGSNCAASRICTKVLRRETIRPSSSSNGGDLRLQC